MQALHMYMRAIGASELRIFLAFSHSNNSTGTWYFRYFDMLVGLNIPTNIQMSLFPAEIFFFVTKTWGGGG